MLLLLHTGLLQKCFLLGGGESGGEGELGTYSRVGAY